MNVDHLLKIPCTITHVTQDGAADEYGNPTKQTTTTESTCWGHQEQSVSGNSDRTGLINIGSERWTYYFPATVELDEDDEVAVADKTYQVKGPPWLANNPRTSRDEMIVATLVRVV